MVEISKRAGARILIDEAHSCFVYGENGRGVVEHFGLEDEVDIHVGTFSKALGGQGGYVAGSQSLYNYLMGFARSRFFSCALAPAVAAGVLAGLRVGEGPPPVRGSGNVAHFRGLMAAAGVDSPSPHAISEHMSNDRKILGIPRTANEALPAAYCTRPSPKIVPFPGIDFASQTTAVSTGRTILSKSFVKRRSQVSALEARSRHISRLPSAGSSSATTSRRN